MRHAAHEAARNFLDAFAEDLVNTDDAGFERKLDDWTNRGFPELAFYRGDRPRDRGEIIAEIRKARRALDGDERALTQATRDELPVLAGALRVAAQSLMDDREAPFSEDGDEPSVLTIPAHNESLKGAGQQLRKPIHMAGEFLNAGNLINHALEQEKLSKMTGDDAIPPHLFVKPRDQDEILNNQLHRFNVYANANPEQRGELNQAAYDKAFELSTNWVKHRRRLSETPDRPKFKHDPAANIAGTVVDNGLKRMGKLPGFAQFSKSDDAFLQTLQQHGYDATDPESVAIATMDPAFQAGLRKNTDRFWLDIAKDIGEGAAKAAGAGLVRRFSPF